MGFNNFFNGFLPFFFCLAAAYCFQRFLLRVSWSFGSYIKVRPHYATRQNATHCSFAARQKLLGICRQCDRVHMKKNFLQTFFRLPKLWNKIGELGVIFFSKWLILFWNPLPIICRAASFDGTDKLPIEFLGRTASNGMPQPSRRNIHI